MEEIIEKPPTNYETIAQRMRNHESTYEKQIPAGEWIVARLDGRSFSSLTTQYYTKPFDQLFHKTMLDTTHYLIAKFEALYGYVASDEISLLFAPEWATFDRRMAKATTLLSATASAYFTLSTQKIATFDARALSFESFDDVSQYFDWRIADVERCALQTAAYWTLRKDKTAGQATRLLTGIGVTEKLNILRQYEIDYHSLPTWQRQGSHLHWETYKKRGFNPIKLQPEMALRRRIIQHDDFLSKEHYQYWLAFYCQHITAQEIGEQL